jgi:hypothetical protein
MSKDASKLVTILIIKLNPGSHSAVQQDKAEIVLARGLLLLLLMMVIKKFAEV